MHFSPARSPTFACVLILGLCAGCASFGPKELERTHGRYNEAVHTVEQEEFLLNLVRVRYNDTPSSLNVSSIAAQHELAAQAEARPFFLAPNPSNALFKTFTAILPDATLSGANRPTLSYVPGDDGSATRQFFTPISADTLVFLTQAGWPVSTVLRLWAERLNGVPNASTASNPSRGLAPDFERFQRIAALLQAAQDHELGTIIVEDRFIDVGGPLPAAAMTAAAPVDAVKNGLEYRRSADGTTWNLVRPGRQLMFQINPGAEASPELVELEGLLNLELKMGRYEITTTSGVVPDPFIVPSPPSTKLQLMPRSTAQVYYYLANGIDVPAEHVQCGLAPATVDASGHVFDTREVTRGLFEVHVARGHKPPPCAFVAVRYHKYWYYIDDKDQASKTAFGLVMQLSRLDFKRQQLGVGPLLTLPAGR